MKTIVTASFIGAEGSLGYQGNKEYTLRISHKIESNIIIEREDGGGRCEYGSLMSFLQNWTNVKVTEYKY